MSDVAIRVDGLGKAYRIGLKEQRHETLLGALGSFLKSPISNFRDLRKLSRFDDAGSFSSSRADVIWAIKDISFAVKPGEVVGIIGQNGAGKSTLLKILSRITEPTEGHAEVFGRVGSLLEVGTGFHPDLTGRENLYLNGTILGMKKREIDRKFDEIVEFSGVEKFIDTPVKRYSSGMRVRLAFSVAAHLEPEILIIDEVLSVGDAEFQKKCLGKMQDVSGQGRTVLFVSHNLTAVQSLCQRGIWLKQGKVVMDDASARVVAAYIQSGERLVTEQTWPDLESAPGNAEVRLVGARVYSPDEPGLLNLGSPLHLEFHIMNFAADSVLNLSYHLFSQEGVLVLASHSVAQALPGGAHKFTCYIPPNLLNDGFYSVELLFVKNSGTVIFKKSDCLTFEIHDLERKSAYFGKYPGAVRFKLDWTIEKANGRLDRPDVLPVGSALHQTT